MRSKILILVVAIVLGLTAAVLSARYIDSARSKVEEQEQPVEVLIAQQDLPAGMSAAELADEKYLKLETVPRRYVSDGAISSASAIEGKVLTVPLAKGEQVTRARFSLPETAGLAFAVPEDFVAISLPNSVDRGVGGLIKPGDTVVVYATFEPGSGVEEARTRLILRKARVLAVGKTTTDAPEIASDDTVDSTSDGMLASGRPGAEVPPTITLALSPADAEKLVFAQEEGRVWLALLGSGTTEVPETPGQSYPGIVE